MHILEDTRPLADFEKHSGEILKQLRETGRPMFSRLKGRQTPCDGREDLRKTFKSSQPVAPARPGGS
jgi:hypothetical protein